VIHPHVRPYEPAAPFSFNHESSAGGNAMLVDKRADFSDYGRLAARDMALSHGAVLAKTVLEKCHSENPPLSWLE
jgi:hypothetical protein